MATRIIVKKVKPLFNSLITTMDLMSEEDMLVAGTNIIDGSKMNKTVKEFQRVLAVGTHVNGIKVGDLVHIDPTAYGRPYQDRKSMSSATEKYETMVSYNFNIVEVDGEPCLKLFDRDVDYIVESWTEEPIESPNPTVYVPKKTIIT